MAKLVDIEGIGQAYAQKLKQYGVQSSDDFLRKAATPKGRKEMSTATGIAIPIILAWVNLADLLTIEGMTPEFAELLRAAGVESKPELALRDPKALHNKMVAVNNEKQLVKKVPSEEVIARWIKLAQKSPRAIEY
jgi:predicted flap endonuclease-1-like 5' DNA nuclease